MKKIITGEIVTLVTLPDYVDVLHIPQIGEYGSHRIVKLTPCEKKNGKLFDLRSGAEVKKKKNSREWVNLSGTVFKYADGLNVLVTKNLATGKLMCVDIASNDIRNTMIPRTIFDRSKKENFA